MHKKRLSAGLILLFCFLLTFSVGAATIEFDGSPITVYAHKEKTTLIIFPERIVDLIKNFKIEEMTIEKANKQRYFFLSPLVKKLETDIYFIGESGIVYMIHLIEDSKKQRDIELRIANRSLLVPDRVKVSKKLTPARLIKAMILGEDLDGVGRVKDDEILLNDPVLGITIQAIKKYDAVYMVGYVANVIMTNGVFDIRKLHNEKLVMGALYKGKGYFVLYK